MINIGLTPLLSNNEIEHRTGDDNDAQSACFGTRRLRIPYREDGDPLYGWSNED